MMTAETRKIRPYDVGAAGGPAEAREAGGGPGAHKHPASLYNDNARVAARFLLRSQVLAQVLAQSDETGEDDAPEERVPASPRARLRGPLVTRWIGYAAQRRQAQARVGRLRERQNARGTESSGR